MKKLLALIPVLALVLPAAAQAADPFGHPCTAQSAGQQTLVSRGVYRLRDNETGKLVFQLFGNGWRFARGHTAKLELVGSDAPFVRASNFSFSVKVSKLSIDLPTSGPG
jgi:hypothetical protein